jgi:hypothetical protein
METKIINGVEHIKERDYLATAHNVQINHLLVDMQDGKIVTHQKMSVDEKEKKNAAARRAGAPLRVWVPALYA